MVCGKGGEPALPLEGRVVVLLSLLLFVLLLLSLLLLWFALSLGLLLVLSLGGVLGLLAVVEVLLAFSRSPSNGSSTTRGSKFSLLKIFIEFRLI